MGNQFVIPSSTATTIRIPSYNKGWGTMEFSKSYPFQVTRMPHDEWERHIHDFNSCLARLKQSQFAVLVVLVFVFLMIMIPISAVFISITAVWIIFAVAIFIIFFISIHMNKARQRTINELRVIAEQKSAAFAAYGYTIRFCCEYHNSGSGRNRHKKPFMWLEIDILNQVQNITIVQTTAYPQPTFVAPQQGYPPQQQYVQSYPPQQYPPTAYPPQQYPPQQYPPPQQQYPPQYNQVVYSPETGYPPQQYPPPQQQPYYTPGPEYAQSPPPPTN